MSSAEELKNQGNTFFSQGNYAEAIQFFSQAIEQDSSNAVLYSNRSASYASLKQWNEALEDAKKTVEFRPEWGKGWNRLAAAYQGMGDWIEAKEACERGLQVDPTNAQLQKTLVLADEKLTKTRQPREFANPFASPDVAARLLNNPKTRGYFSDPEFVQKIQDLQKNPQNLGKYMQDERMMSVLSVLLNVSMDDGPRTEEEPINVGRQSEPLKKTEVNNEKGKEKETAVVEETQEEKEAARLKELGTEAYKKKDFVTALKMYEDAFALTPKNPQLLLNQSAVHFESGKFEDAVRKAQESIDLARDLDKPVDYQFYGKAYARMANAYVKMDQLDDAIKFYNKSLTEHRLPETLKKLREVEKTKEQRSKESYRNPELAEAARNKGNAEFKDGKFADAVVSYTEAIKRDDKDPKAYSNRAACYLKLAAIPEGLKDCETALTLDPTFVRALIRKAALLFAKKDYTGCIEACHQASDLDSEKKQHTQEIQQQQFKALAELNKHQDSATSEAEVADRVNRDPELQQILGDPVMRSILQQMQSDPKAAQDHLKNPVVAAKIRKLVAAGVLRTQ